ncbi:hypothetical protein KDAU_40770 [Dictyobacter aurantiacus]|uniref:Uncharacterized protein n=1 Tax=Dictyobacter aurantiacus TaxID=1936993 RepID=A0A401ZIT8_9CHLR|nr:hypothetical protein KDAU_40770 [Dictyobacter aurantiacus]
MFPPGNFARNFLFNELDMAEMQVVSQFQNVHFILFQALVNFGDSQIGKRLSCHPCFMGSEDENLMQ